MSALGILMLDTKFPRPSGDIGCAESFPFPVIYRTIPRASAEEAVRGDAEAFYAAFLDAAEALVAEGASVISTSCGFLALYQDRLTAALPVTVLTSALVTYAARQAALPENKRVGVLTIDAEALTPRHLAAAGVPQDAAIVGLDKHGPLATMIFEDRPVFDTVAVEVEAEMIAAARQLAKAEPALGAVLLECTNMGPYAPAIRAALGVPVFGIVEGLCELMEATHGG